MLSGRGQRGGALDEVADAVSLAGGARTQLDRVAPGESGAVRPEEGADEVTLVPIRKLGEAPRAVEPFGRLLARALEGKAGGERLGATAERTVRRGMKVA